MPDKETALSKTCRTVLSLLLVAGVVVVLAFAAYRLYLQHAPPENDKVPTWVKGVDPKAVEAQQKRLALLRDARETLAVNPEQGREKLRRLMKDLRGTPEGSEAKLILAQQLAKEPLTRPEAAELYGQVIAEPNAARRSLRARLYRGRLLLEIDPEAAKKDLAFLTAETYERGAPRLWAQASIALADQHVREGQPRKAIGLLAPILRTGMGERAEARLRLRDAIEAHAKMLTDSGAWTEYIQWAEHAIEKYSSVPGFRNILRFRQAVAHRHLGNFADAHRILERLRRLLTAAAAATISEDDEGPGAEAIDIDGELAALAKAELAAGIRRSPEAFLQAKDVGEENRPHFAGTIDADTTWAAEDTPLVLTGPVTVQAGATLTVEPGAQVQFLQGAKLLVEGALVAAGTEEQRVTFTSAVRQADARSAYDGEGLELAPGSDAAASRFEHCVVEHQRTGLMVRGIALNISSSIFRHNGRAALRFLDGSKATLAASTVQENEGTGVGAEQASPTLRQCRILKNRGAGVVFEGTSKPTVQACRIADNQGRGIICDNGASATITASLIRENGEGGIYGNRFAEARIQGNRIEANRRDGITLERDADAQVIGNLITKSGNRGVVIENAEPEIRNNRVVGNHHYGIECVNAAPLIEGNLIAGNRSAGITALEASQPTIHRNIIGYHDPSFIGNPGSLDVDARNNYFEKGGKAPSDEEMEKYIFHHADHNICGTVYWEPRLAERPPEPPVPTLDNLP
jgi:hypothetical protein